MADEMNGERETPLGFQLEKRGDVWVVQYVAGGCQPASIAEVALWKAFQADRASHGQAPAGAAEGYVLASAAAQIAGDACWSLPMPKHWDRDKEAYSDWCAAQSKFIRGRILALATPTAQAAPATQQAGPSDQQILEMAGRYWVNLDETEQRTEIALVKDALRTWGNAPQPSPTAQAAPAAATIPHAELANLHEGLAANLHDGPARNLHLETAAALRAPAAGAVAGPSLQEIQWRNIRKVVDALADFCFGSQDDPRWGVAHVAIRTSLTAKDGLDVQALKLEPLAAPTPAAQADSGVQEDAARLDWLDQNIFHREMSQWDKTLGGWEAHNMWVMFAPKGAQGSARNILDAARAQQKEGL